MEQKVKKKKTVERRKYKRYSIPRGAYVALKPGYIVGQITDISTDGLAFSYYAAEEPSNESSELDIYLTGSSALLGNIPCETIEDFVLVELPFGNGSLRRRHVQFRGIKQDQISQLENFIENHATGEV